MAGGIKKGAWLREQGIGAGKVDVEKVYVSALYLHPEGHPLAHPRANDPLDEALVLDIMEKGIEEPALVRVEFAGKKSVLAVCDGCRRTRHGLEAERRLIEAGDTKLLKQDDQDTWHLPIKVEFLPADTSDIEFLKQRQLADSRIFKSDHSIRVVAVWIIQMHKLGAEAKVIYEALPKNRGWTKQHADAVLLYWHTLSKDLVKRFDSNEIPIGLLPVVLKTAPEDREKVISKLLEAEVTSVQGATRFMNREARLAAEAAGEEYREPEVEIELTETDIEDDGLDAGPESDERPSAKRNKVEKPNGRGKGGEAKKSSYVLRVVKFAREQPKLTKAESAFFLGAQAAVDPRNAREMAKIVDGLGDEAKNLIAGMLWRHGIWTPTVQGLVNERVFTTLDAADEKPAKQKKASAK